ncbi:MAG: hypothetical protein ACK2UB_03940 [Anaerolineales bacterium]
MRKYLPPILTLFFLSPVIGELVSGSAPPGNWLQPGTYLVMVPLYGAGALLVRELAVRWKAGWFGVILLGAAYGIVEEGIDVMSFFNTAWPDLGNNAWYGRWAEVSWVWTIHLTGYHAAFSIAIPILLTHLIFPRVRGQSWMGCGGLLFFGGLEAAIVLIGNLLFRAAFEYSPPALPYCLSFAVVGLLVVAARRTRVPHPAPDMEHRPLPAPWLYGLASFLATTIFFFSAWFCSDHDLSPLWAILAIFLSSAAILAILGRSYRRGKQFTDGRKLALASGGPLFLALLTPITESRGIDPGTGESFSGMICVGAATVLALIMLSVVVRRRERRAAQAISPPSAMLHGKPPPRGMFDDPQ